MRSAEHVVNVQQRNMLVSVGEDETPSPKVSAMSLKLWDLDKMSPEGSSTSGPACLRSIRVFTNKFPEAKVRTLLQYA